jgi:glycosyltransferase involved in cell wall biosynthesis
VTRVVAISDFIRDRLLKLGIRPDRVVTVHNGVDLERFRPNDLAKTTNEIVLSTILYLRDIKRPDVTFKACGILAERGVAFQLLVAGTGPLLESMKQLTKALGYADQVRWLGETHETETILQASDLFLLSTVGEALGNALLEAQACGVPVVATRSGGIPEVVHDGETGLLFPSGNFRAMADCIEYVLLNPKLRRRMSVAARERMENHFHMQRAVKDFLDVHQSLVPSWESCHDWPKEFEYPLHDDEGV